MKPTIIGILVYILASNITLADDTPPTQESWYYFLNFSFPYISYFGELDQRQKSIKESTNSSSSAFGGNFIGLYLPIPAGNTIAGIQLASTQDDTYGNETISQDYTSLSVIHFIEDRIGRGLYVRGDIGVATLEHQLKNPVSITETTEVKISESGFGGLMGIGYGFEISNETRILISANFTAYKYDSGGTAALSVNAGFLW